MRKLVSIYVKLTMPFQMAEVAVPRRLFADVLWLIRRLRAPPAPA